ncbi:type II and III secretion system protein family protein [Massilia sp.]|uniref:type II and III secretion system protein family protein n=1 Tax=Massilia sp. TaxID=1882437 RepID=UPI0028A73E9D|nr:type II and III secretion system protein family protein [Massilia sp.]
MTLLNDKTLLAAALLLSAQAGHAAPADCIDLRGTGDTARRFDLVLGKSVIKHFCSPASQVTVGAPGVANVVVPSPNEVVIVARSVGSTNLIVSSRDGRSTVIDLNVGLDTAPLRAQFDALFPQEKDVRIGSSGTTLILSGMVSDAAVASQLIALATAYKESSVPAAAAAGSPAPAGVAAPAPAAASAPANAGVINMMSIAAPQQVLLEVKIAEISKSLVDQFGANAGFARTNGSWSYNIASNLLTGSGVIGGVKTVGGVVTKQFGIDGENRDGLVKILAEPTVMAVSGQEASFLAGGKIFIPVAQTGLAGANTITLEEKEYGVAVKFTPTVLGGGRINLRVAPEVSELNREGIGVSAGNSNATAILPAFTTRRATTTVQLQDGQSFAIGGLIRNNVTSNIKRFPFLGEMPVLGALFRSSDFQNDRTELVFIVTPHLAKPMEETPALPTDGYVQPSRAQFLLGGTHEGYPAPANNAATKDKP